MADVNKMVIEKLQSWIISELAENLWYGFQFDVRVAVWRLKFVSLKKNKYHVQNCQDIRWSFTGIMWFNRMWNGKYAVTRNSNSLEPIANPMTISSQNSSCYYACIIRVINNSLGRFGSCSSSMGMKSLDRRSAHARRPYLLRLVCWANRTLTLYCLPISVYVIWLNNFFLHIPCCFRTVRALLEQFRFHWDTNL